MAWFGGKAGAWVVDHSLDEVPMYTSRHGSIATIGDKIDGPDYSAELETPEERKARKRSHFVAYSTMFVMSVGFSIVLSGVWPYMKELDGTLQKSALGWVVAANPLGQMIASPLLGLWGNKSGSIRGALIASITIFIGGNIMYSTLYAFRESGPGVAYGMMILSRFIVGVSSANVTLCRSYLAGSTTLAERTTGIAIIAASQALGFVIGPGIQAVLTITMDKAITTGIPGLVFDKYTLAGWVAAALGLVNLIFVMPCIFQEHYIAAKEYQFMAKKNPDANKAALPAPNYIGVSVICFAFFAVIYVTSVRETIATPLVADQYAVTNSTAMLYVSIGLCVAGFMSVFLFMGAAKLSQVLEERFVLITFGFVPLVISLFLHYPIGNVEIKMANCTSTTTNIMSTTTDLPYFNVNNDVGPYNYNRYSDMFDISGTTILPVEEEECVGCPPIQTWCETTAQLTPPQLIVSFLISVLGYPIAMSLLQTVFAKSLGPRPLGLWMGILTGCGSLARITGPLWIAYVYETKGTIYTFCILGGIELLATIVLIVFFKQTAPLTMSVTSKVGNDNKVAEDEL